MNSIKAIFLICMNRGIKKCPKQAGAELGQAQLKLGLDIDFSSELHLHWTNQLELSLEIWLAGS